MVYFRQKQRSQTNLATHTHLDVKNPHNISANFQKQINHRHFQSSITLGIKNEYKKQKIEISVGSTLYEAPRPTKLLCDLANTKLKKHKHNVNYVSMPKKKNHMHLQTSN